MIRAFFHVDEFGINGMTYLPHLICLSNPLVVWSPSARLLKATPRAFMSPRELLSLIDSPDAPVRIIGRREWLLDKQFRNSHPWKLAAWTEDFDSVVKRLAIEEESKPLPERKIIIANDEEGYDKAEKILSSENGQRVARQLRTLYQKRLLPAGILEKAHRAREQRKSVPRTILRDVYNHSRAIASAHAQVAMIPSEHMAILYRIVPDIVIPGITTFDQTRKGDVSSADLREAVRVLNKVKPILNIKEVKNFLKSDLKRDLQYLMYSPHSSATLEAHIVKQVNEAISHESLFKHLFPPDNPIGQTLTLGGLVVGLTSLLLTGHLEWELISLAVRAIQGPLRKYSMIPEAVQPGHSARALFYLICGTERPRRKQIQDLLASLSV